MYTEDFVTYEQALALKELGFDLDCYACYLSGNFTNNMPCSNYNVAPFKNNCSAPTLAQAQKWFRNKGYSVEVTSFYQTWISSITNLDDFQTIELNENFSSYEEALSVGITECLKLLEKKN